MTNFLKILAPERCVLCHLASTTPVCATCHREANLMIHTRHQIDRYVPGTMVPLCSFASYHGRIKQLVHLAKSQHLERSALVDPWLLTAARRLAESWRDAGPVIVVPLPERRFGLDTRRRLAGDLAQLLASELRMPCQPRLLRFKKGLSHYCWKAQKERNRIQRMLYPPQFELGETLPPAPYQILLVDDVCTTGETLRAAIRPLQAARQRVSGAALLADTPSCV